MAIRLRTVDGRLIAVCAAMTMPQAGDVYLDDAVHHALSQKFAEDFASEGFDTGTVIDPCDALLRSNQQANNSAREDWDRMYRQ